jgi:hypothetical protein
LSILTDCDPYNWQRKYGNEYALKRSSDSNNLSVFIFENLPHWTGGPTFGFYNPAKIKVQKDFNKKLGGCLCRYECDRPYSFLNGDGDVSEYIDIHS